MGSLEFILADLVTKEILPKLRHADASQLADRETTLQHIQRLRHCWGTSSVWKVSIEKTIDSALWHLSRWEAEVYRNESTDLGRLITLI